MGRLTPIFEAYTLLVFKSVIANFDNIIILSPTLAQLTFNPLNGCKKFNLCLITTNSVSRSDHSHFCCSTYYNLRKAHVIGCNYYKLRMMNVIECNHINRSNAASYQHIYKRPFASN